jgi:virulence RhuM family protein
MKDEIILYQSENLAKRLEVRVENETVWLNRQQIATLFDRDVKTIGKHLANVLKEELKGLSVVAKFATTADDGKIYQVEYFSLDMIISIGYRVKSHRGIQFRIWANKILRDYLLKGYSLNLRINRVENTVYSLAEKVNTIDLQIRTNLPPKQGIFYDGQIFDAYVFAATLIKSAKKSILLIDNYIDESVLQLFAKRKKNVGVSIHTKVITKILKQDLEKYNAQYPEVKIIKFTKAHDRFLIIDDTTVYHFGASLKDLGKKWFAFSKMDLESMEIIANLNNGTGNEKVDKKSIKTAI